MARAIDWQQYDTLKAQGLADREIARRCGIPWSTFHREKQRRGGLDKGVSLQTPQAPYETPRVSKRVSQGVPVKVLAIFRRHHVPTRL